MPESGSDMAAGLMTRVSDAGVSTMFEQVTAIEPGGDAVRVVAGESEHFARYVILACGASLRPLGIPGESEFEHRGVSHCADCDAPLFAGQEVVVGGGDSAVQEALVLASFCERVHLVHRGESFTARQEFVSRLRETPNVVTHMNTVVESLEGGEQLTGARLRRAGASAGDLLPCSGFFAYGGLAPNTGWLPAQSQSRGHAVTMDENERNVPGVFAVGAVRDGYGACWAIRSARSTRSCNAGGGLRE